MDLAVDFEVDFEVDFGKIVVESKLIQKSVFDGGFFWPENPESHRNSEFPKSEIRKSTTTVDFLEATMF